MAYVQVAIALLIVNLGQEMDGDVHQVRLEVLEGLVIRLRPTPFSESFRASRININTSKRLTMVYRPE